MAFCNWKNIEVFAQCLLGFLPALHSSFLLKWRRSEAIVTSLEYLFLNNYFSTRRAVALQLFLYNVTSISDNFRSALIRKIKSNAISSTKNASTDLKSAPREFLRSQNIKTWKNVEQKRENGI